MDYTIDKFVPAGPCLLYLDTSVVFRLSHKHRGTLAPEEERRVAHLTALLVRLSTTKSQALYSILAIEEVGAKVRNEVRKRSTDLVRAHAAMLTAMQDAVDVLHGIGATLAHPKASGTPEDAKRLRRGHRGLLQQNPALDPMDALHIIVGWELQCNHFVSFDNGWKGIAGINLIHH